MFRELDHKCLAEIALALQPMQVRFSVRNLGIFPGLRAFVRAVFRVVLRVVVSYFKYGFRYGFGYDFGYRMNLPMFREGDHKRLAEIALALQPMQVQFSGSVLDCCPGFRVIFRIVFRAVFRAVLRVMSRAVFRVVSRVSGVVSGTG